MENYELAQKLLGLPFVQGKTAGTRENLEAALIVEDFVSDVWFPTLAAKAHAEGRDDLAKLLESIARSEKSHADVLREALRAFN